MDPSNTAPCAEKILGYRFSDPAILEMALTHASVANTRLESNERMEFLGDTVLALVVCEELYRQFDGWLEGDLTKVKSAVVSRKTCAKVSDEIGLTDLLVLGNGLDRRYNLPTSVKAAVFESVIGGMYVDGGLEPSRKFILRVIRHHIEACAASDDQENYKSALQQQVQRALSGTPHYEILDEQGPDHCKCFEVCVVINGTRYPSAWGPNKKHAEQEAAHRALKVLRSINKDA